MNRWLAMFLIAAMALVACSGMREYTRYEVNGGTVTLGMTIQEVEDIMGPPDEITSDAPGMLGPQSNSPKTASGAATWLYLAPKEGVKHTQIDFRNYVVDGIYEVDN